MKTTSRNRLKRLRWHGTHTVVPILLIGALSWLSRGYTVDVPTPPLSPDNACAIFMEHPSWYDAARASRERWGTPIATQLAFVYYESSFRSHVRPPRTRLFDIIPWSRPTSAYGYAQAVDPAWRDYMEDAGSMFASRSQMKHALDFIGWYNHRSHQQVGIALTNPRDLYLAYHEGPTGFRQGRHHHKPEVIKLADRVANRAALYRSQLPECEPELRCRRFYQFGPFCY